MDLLPHVLYFLCLMSIGWSGGILVSSPTAIQGFSHNFIAISERNATKVQGIWWLAGEQLDFGWGLTNEKRRSTVSPFPHTSGHVDCPACAALRDALMQTGQYKDLTVTQAGLMWLKLRKPFVRPKTYQHYSYCVATLSAFWPELKLSEIEIGHIAHYQEKRQEEQTREVKQNGGKTKPRVCRAGARTINHEINTLSQIMTRAGLWHKIEPYYEPLPIPRWNPPKVVTQEEEDRFFEVAAREIFEKKNRERLIAYCASSIMVNTGMRGGELRGLKLENIDWQRRKIFVPPELAKTKKSVRNVALNEKAFKHLEWLAIIAREHGSHLPEHHLIPFRIKRNSYDPTRPTKGWRTAFRKMLADAGLPPRLTPPCLRHQFITKGLENPSISEHTMMAQVGHISREVLDHYSHTRIEAKRAAVSQLEPVNQPGKPIRGTKEVTELFTEKAMAARKKA